MPGMKSKPGQQWVVEATAAGQRLDKWLAAAERLGSRSKALTAIERGRVFLNDIEQSSNESAAKVNSGDRVRVWHDRPGSATKRYFERRDSGLHIIYEDEALLVINKPPGLLTVPLAAQPDQPSLLDRVALHLRSARRTKPLVVHRIDRDTSGLVVFAKIPAAMLKLKDQFEKRQPERVYLAFVHGIPSEEKGTWSDLLVWDNEKLIQRPFDETAPEAKRLSQAAQNAICHYRLIARFAAAALLEIRLVTGKRNQIRIQASLHGHPLIGEKVYRPENFKENPNLTLGRQALHSFRLSFIHPTTGQRVKFEAPLPADLEGLRARL